MERESKQALDEWAEQIAGVEPEVAKGVLTYAEQLAADGRLAQSDRDFAQAQADAIRRASRRIKARSKQSRK